MTQIIQQVEKGVAEILKNSSISEVYLCGHSAGAHLAACLLHSDFNQRLNVDINKIKGFFLVAGVYDLTPLLKTDVNDNVKMDLVEATKSSPMFINETCFSQNISILVVYGENESNEFKKQSKDYSNHLTKLNFNNVCCEQIDAVDHFDLIENLSSDNFILTKKIYEVMNIN